LLAQPITSAELGCVIGNDLLVSPPLWLSAAVCRSIAIGEAVGMGAEICLLLSQWSPQGKGYGTSGLTTIGPWSRFALLATAWSVSASAEPCVAFC
tara:strand:+ start:422 stop:709 length:288 start_codon:yes stop_codon:yes gene_type:complete